MPALLARPGVQSLLLRQRSPSSSARDGDTEQGEGRGHGSSWDRQQFPLALLLSSALCCSSRPGRILAFLPRWVMLYCISSRFFNSRCDGAEGKPEEVKDKKA